MLHNLCYTIYFVFVNFYANSVIINAIKKNYKKIKRKQAPLYISKNQSAIPEEPRTFLILCFTRFLTFSLAGPR